MSLAALSSSPVYGAQQALERVAQLQALIARANEPATSTSLLTGGTVAPSASGETPAPGGSSDEAGDFAGALAQASAEEAQPTGTSAASAYETPSYGTSPAPYSDPGYTAATADYPASMPGYGLSAPAYGTATPSTYESVPADGSEAPASAAAYEGMIEQAAARNGIEPAILHGLIQQESGFDPNARSGAGAMGLTQLMPSTAAAMGVSDPLDPQQSIEGGARYLGEMLNRFGGNVTDAIAAYNAGPGAVSEYGGVPPYTETQNYVSKVLENAASYRASHMGVIQ